MNPVPTVAPLSQTQNPRAQKKKDSLSVVALVLASLFFVPLAPLVGLVLGIVALSTRRNKTLGILAVCIGGFFTLFVGIEIAIAVPAFMKYKQRVKTIEAIRNTKLLGQEISALSAQQWASLPDSEWTPRESACTLPTKMFAYDAARWSAAPWSTLDFEVMGPSRYQYRVQREAQGFVVEAQTDLECNGKVERLLRHVTPEGIGEITIEYPEQ